MEQNNGWNENGNGYGAGDNPENRNGGSQDGGSREPGTDLYRMKGCGDGNDAYSRYYTRDTSTGQDSSSGYTSAGRDSSSGYTSAGRDSSSGYTSTGRSSSDAYTTGNHANSGSYNYHASGGQDAAYSAYSDGYGDGKMKRKLFGRKKKNFGASGGYGGTDGGYGGNYGGTGNGGRKKHKGFGWAIARCAVLAVIFGLISGGIFLGMNRIGSGETENTAPAAANSEDTDKEDVLLSEGKVDQTETTSASASAMDVSDIVEDVMPSIVSITNMTETQYRDWWGQTGTYEEESCGSGVILSQDDENLYIATNNHVVEGATTITVSFIDDSTATAEVKGTDSTSDLAVVSIPVSSISEETLSQIKVATLGDSENLEVGEAAIAIGNALGYGQSVTTGVISAVNREVTLTDDTTGQSITNELIQTDAAINPGNSGGALLNTNGEVIGINSAKFASDEIEGMGFAIPISTAQPILSDLITREIVDEEDSAYLGINGVDVDSAMAETYSMPEGIYVALVYEGTAAENCGLRKGDIITSFGGRSVNSMEALQELMQYYASGTEVEIVIQRNSEGEYAEQTLSCVLGSKKG